MAEDSNAHRFRIAQWQMVQNAIAAEDHDEIERLCHEGLQDPFLPLLFRAESHLMLSMYENAAYHLDEAAKMADHMDQILTNANATDPYVAELRERIATLRPMVPGPEEMDGKGLDGDNMEETAGDTEDAEEAPAQDSTPAPPSSS